ncbi:MAG: quinolinate synthase NadA [Candidatus Cloacimonetes bacterium]|nr:quinolinate synthase NadA [Candidatus Cloacimonadota bacterium]MBL7148602.1 quinolinate synthase NadA [Candidatus Cloacimonadota bacterium]
MKIENWDELQAEELYEIAEKLKKEKNCFVLAHNYQFMEVQKIADYVGDSLQMAKVATKTEAKIILLCGIKIMAETVKILNPDKKVLMSHYDADCPLANMKSPDDLRALRKKYPDAEVVCYVNSPAALKAESTITCTSANAVKVVSSIPKEKQVIFVPDKNIGAWVAYKNNRELIMFDSYCYVHEQITLEEAMMIKEEYPDYSLIVHPECTLDVCKEADLVCSTSQMIDFVKENDRVIIGTEIGLYYQLKYHYPEKHLVPLSPKMICDDMKKTDLRGVVRALEEEKYEITVPANIKQKAKKSLDRMLLFI